MTAGLSVVQFVHPGFEYRCGTRREPNGVMGWKPGRSVHNRKFMVSPGAMVDTAGRDHPSATIAFWGEWEGPSVFWRVDSPGKPVPSVLHAPFRPAEGPTASVQNTDPLVFGDQFVYSNCLQPVFKTLRSLAPGSIVLFGRYSRSGGNPSFGLDTCLVVDRCRPMAPHPFFPLGDDLLADAVLGPLFTEDLRVILNVYFGRTRAQTPRGPFSFLPARLFTGEVPLFVRPALEPCGALDGVISPANMQGIKVTANCTIDRLDAIWGEVVRQVIASGSGLGYHASAPPLVEAAAAAEAAACVPGPLVRLP